MCKGQYFIVYIAVVLLWHSLHKEQTLGRLVLLKLSFLQETVLAITYS